MINLNIILEEVPNYLLDGIQEDFEDVQDGYCLVSDATINKNIGRMCLDLENNANSLAEALQNSLMLLDDMGLSPYIVEMGVLK